MTKTDIALQRDIIDELHWDPSVGRAETADGKVTLRGTVRSWTERQDAERAAWSAPGVTAVDDQIAISVPVGTL